MARQFAYRSQVRGFESRKGQNNDSNAGTHCYVVQCTQQLSNKVKSEGKQGNAGKRAPSPIYGSKLSGHLRLRSQNTLSYTHKVGLMICRHHIDKEVEDISTAVNHLRSP